MTTGVSYMFRKLCILFQLENNLYAQCPEHINWIRQPTKIKQKMIIFET